MLLNREIQILQAELNIRADIACALAGRFVREGECTSQVLAASAEDFRICRACHHGQLLARSSGLPVRKLPMLADLPAWAKLPRSRKSPLPFELELAARAAREREPLPKRIRAKRITKPKAAKTVAVQALLPMPSPSRPALDARLAKLASVLRELTADGRMRVSMLDLVRGLSAANYDEAGALVEAAGLRTSRLYGPVQAVLVDHNLRQLLERAAESEIRQ